ncbi:pickpocket protein 28-like [Sitophilus oryzae]|uniref:Pickpocket protein 28-like n=1 Tax=Sitophilus oryzae TaxID=7048 RepID=A0A6J2YBB8_SITOR|nr:pickpocket protein 28-like [Sitophilus oryzae]
MTENVPAPASSRKWRTCFNPCTLYRVSPHYGGIIWIIMFCASLVTCITVVYEVFKKWQKSPIIVNFASHEVNIFDITFPAVTICPETKVFSDHFNYSYNLRRSLNENMSKDDLKKLQYMSLLCNVNEYFHKVSKIRNIDEEFFHFLKNGSPSFLTKCLWMGQDASCNEIFQPLYTDEGLCLTFNMLSKREMYTKAVENIDYPPSTYKDRLVEHWSTDHGYTDDAGIDTYPRRALVSGSTNSLEVNFAVNNTDLDYGCTHFQGYKVVLHSPHRFPTVHSHYFRIPLKKSVSAAITPSVLSTSRDVADYNVKKRKCFFQTDMKLKFFSNYSQINCKLECLIDLTIEICGCVQYFMPRNKSTPMCGTEQYECLKLVEERQALVFMESNLAKHKLMNKHFHKHFGGKKNMSSKYSCNCPSMCNTIDYNVEITESDYDWPRKMAAIGIDVVTEDEEGMSSSQLQIYFKSNTFIPQQRNELYGTFDFLANVGGLLGLFIGFSILSMIELIYFLTLRIIYNLKLYQTWYGKPNTSNITCISSIKSQGDKGSN